jgi:multidrug efflux system membrane fusion protein
MFSPVAIRLHPVITGALLALVTVTAVGCNEKQAETKPVIRPVKVVEIARADTTRALDYSGSVQARTNMNLGFRINGKITDRRVNIGEHVKPGDILARVDATDYALAVRRSEADLASAQKQVQTAELALNRAKELFDKNVSPKSQLEQAQLSYDQAVATRDSATSALDEARNQVAYADLKSDLNGIVTAVNADVGAVVSSGTPVITVAVDGEKEVQVAVPETDIAQFSPGKLVKARFWSNDALVLDGKVREVSGSADAQSRTFGVRVSLPADQRVLIGMTSTIEATAENTTPFVSVPLSALAEKDGKKVVWLVDRSSATVHSQGVQLADFSGDGVRVSSGLKAGDLVVAAGTQFMSENLQVKLPDGAGQQAAAAEPVDGAAPAAIVR